MDKKANNKNVKPSILTRNEGKNARKSMLPAAMITAPYQDKLVKEKAVFIGKERVLPLEDHQQVQDKQGSQKKSFAFGSFCQRYIKPNIEFREIMNGEPKRKIYLFQDDLLVYLNSIEKDFMISVGKRKKPKLFFLGLDFFKKVRQDKNLKADTMMLACYLWHKLYHNTAVPDSFLERYMAVCLWIACKQEEYYPIASRSLIGYFESFKIVRGGAKLAYISLMADSLLEAELQVLGLNNFKIFTPPFFSLLHIYEVEIFPERKASYSRYMNFIVEAAYYKPELFSFSLSILALAALSKFSEDRDEERSVRAIKRYMADRGISSQTSFEKASQFLTDAVEERRREKLDSLNSMIVIKEVGYPS